jgi:phenylacetate-CoA ligase
MIDWRIRALDMAKNLKVRQYYRAFLSDFKRSSADLSLVQNHKLKQLLQYLNKYNNFYQKRFKDAGFDPESKSDIEQFAQLPVLTKEDIRLYQSQIISSGKNYKSVFKHSSSGTTGEPIQFYHHQQSESAGIGGVYAIYSSIGWSPGKRTFHIWGNPSSVKKWQTPKSRFKQKLLNQVNINAFDLGQRGNLEIVSKQILQKQPLFIDGYANSIYQLALYFAEKGKSIDYPLSIMTTGEELLASSRQTIEQYLGPVLNLYGCSEINAVAFQPSDENVFFILDSHVYLERDADGGAIITDLDNYYFPFIRYKNGDRISPPQKAISNSTYPFSTFNELQGRSTDYIVLASGQKIFPITLLGGTLFRRSGKVRRHRVKWNGQQLQITIEADDASIKKEIETKLAAYLRAYNVPFKVEVVRYISPLPSGKYQYFVDETKGNK